jgi:hypothetical protein
MSLFDRKIVDFIWRGVLDGVEVQPDCLRHVTTAMHSCWGGTGSAGCALETAMEIQKDGYTKAQTGETHKARFVRESLRTYRQSTLIILRSSRACHTTRPWQGSFWVGQKPKKKGEIEERNEVMDETRPTQKNVGRCTSPAARTPLAFPGRWPHTRLLVVQSSPPIANPPASLPGGQHHPLSRFCGLSAFPLSLPHARRTVLVSAAS